MSLASDAFPWPQQQRLGCLHGEELPYVWGAPLVDSLAHFPTNYTQAEVKLSETVLTYWVNFAKMGYAGTSLMFGCWELAGLSNLYDRQSLRVFSW